jgi:hypothetical protein
VALCKSLAEVLARAPIFDGMICSIPLVGWRNRVEGSP